MSQEPVIIQAGTVLINKYRINQEINHGSFSTIYEAENIQNKKKYAIKATDISKYELDEIKNIQREIYLLSKLSHNNIIKNLDIFYVESTQYSVMDILQPIATLNLTALADEQRYLTYKKMAVDLFGALKYMSTVQIDTQQKGVIHRNIKADNVMVRMEENGDFSTIIIGFSAARSLSVYQSQMIYDIGNIYYKAPECFGDNPQYSTASDLWAVGILLFEYATKMKVYQPVTQKLIRNGRVRPVPDDIDSELKLLITDILNIDPEVRIAAMNAFLENNKDLIAERSKIGNKDPLATIKADLKDYEVREQIKGTEIYRLTKNNQQFCAVHVDKKGLDNERIQSIKKEKDFLAEQNFKFVLTIVEIIDCKDAIYKIYKDFTPIQFHLSDKAQNDIQSTIATSLLDICMLLKYLQQKQLFLKNIEPTSFVTFVENEKAYATIIDYSYCSAITQAVPKQSKYHAPEAWKENQYSVEGDVWSAGISWFELASKEDPYKNKSQHDVANGLYNQLPASINKISQQVITSMLQSKEKRLSNIQQVISNPQLKQTLIKRLEEKQLQALIGDNQAQPVKKSTYNSLTNLTKQDIICPLSNGKNQIRNQKVVLYSKFVAIQRNQNSCVYYCEDQTEANNCKQVVMKIQDIYSKSSEQVEKIIQEMKIKPDHKNLIKVIDGFIEEYKGVQYIITIMEKGFSFMEFFADGIKVEVLIKIIQECCYDLLYMLGEHPDKYGCYVLDGKKCHFIHRDIKPANIIIHGTKEDWNVAICDFNACKELANQNRPKTYIGTSGYMAPEIENLDENESYTKAVDVFSLGKTILAWMQQFKIQHEGIKNLVDMMTQNKPEDRPTLEAVLEMLENPDQFGEQIQEQVIEQQMTATKEQQQQKEIEQLKQQVNKQQMALELQQKQINEKDDQIGKQIVEQHKQIEQKMDKLELENAQFKKQLEGLERKMQEQEAAQEMQIQVMQNQLLKLLQHENITDSIIGKFLKKQQGYQ